MTKRYHIPFLLFVAVTSLQACKKEKINEENNNEVITTSIIQGVPPAGTKIHGYLYASIYANKTLQPFTSLRLFANFSATGVSDLTKGYDRYKDLFSQDRVVGDVKVGDLAFNTYSLQGKEAASSHYSYNTSRSVKLPLPASGAWNIGGTDKYKSTSFYFIRPFPFIDSTSKIELDTLGDNLLMPAKAFTPSDSTWMMLTVNYNFSAEVEFYRVTPDNNGILIPFSMLKRAPTTVTIMSSRYYYKTENGLFYLFEFSSKVNFRAPY
jgi:hypothetical protein